MKKKFLIALYCGLGALIVVSTFNILCTGLKNQKVVVVDVEKVKKEALLFQTINSEAEKYVNALSVRVNEDKKALQTEAIALNKRIEKSGKSASDFTNEIETFTRKEAAFRNKIQFQSQLISRATQSALQQINPVIQSVLKEISEDQDIQVMLPKSFVTYNVSAIDITDDIIERLNKKDFNVVYPDPAQFTALASSKIQENKSMQAGTQSAPENEQVVPVANVGQSVNGVK